MLAPNVVLTIPFTGVPSVAYRVPGLDGSGVLFAFALRVEFRVSFLLRVEFMSLVGVLSSLLDSPFTYLVAEPAREPGAYKPNLDDELPRAVSFLSVVAPLD